MDFLHARITEQIGPPHPRYAPITAAVWRRADIEAAIDRLLDTPPAQGHRSLVLAHEQAGQQGTAPGIGVTISVLSPGERSPAHRHTHSVINFVRQGHGHSVIDGRRIDWGPGDIFTTPAWVDHQHVTAKDSPQSVRFSITDRPLLEKLGVSLSKVADDEVLAETAEADLVPPPAPEPPTGRELSNGARLLTYREMLKPVSAWDEPMLWRFADVRSYLDPMDDDDPEYHGRRVVMLYHPGTGASQGTTRTMNAFVGIIVPGEEHVAHRHTSTAINYYTAGSGNTIVGNLKFDWEAGDLAVTPGWVPHRHANFGDETAWGITVHDAPLLYNTGALLWQEVLGEEIGVLGRDEKAAAAAERLVRTA